MNKKLDELMPEIFKLHQMGWSYLKIAKKYELDVNSIRRRILKNNVLSYGEHHYYKNKYVIQIYDFETNEKVKAFKNLTELKHFLNRETTDFFSQALSRKIDYIYSKDTSQKFRFELIEKEKYVEEQKVGTNG